MRIPYSQIKTTEQLQQHINATIKPQLLCDTKVITVVSVNNKADAINYLSWDRKGYALGAFCQFAEHDEADATVANELVKQYGEGLEKRLTEQALIEIMPQLRNTVNEIKNGTVF